MLITLIITPNCIISLSTLIIRLCRLHNLTRPHSLPTPSKGKTTTRPVGKKVDKNALSATGSAPKKPRPPPQPSPPPSPARKLETDRGPTEVRQLSTDRGPTEVRQRPTES